MAATSLPVEHLFTITADTKLACVLPTGPQGGRVVVEASSGTFQGPKLNGTVVPPGGDWVTLQPDGSMRLDVRITLLTDDGAHILMSYQGIGTDGGKTLVTAPRFETADERYAWLNSVQAIATGGTGDDKVTYDVYRLAPATQATGQATT